MPGRPLFALVLAVLALLTLSAVARAGPSSHPYFDDGGALQWYRSYDQALRAAKAEGKLVFIEYGRHRCGSCKKLCSDVLAHPQVHRRLGKVAVGFAAECDNPDPRVRSMFVRRLPRARMLPFAAFVTADGVWVSGFAGYCTPGTFLTHLQTAERRKPRALARPAPRLVDAAPQRRRAETHAPKSRVPARGPSVDVAQRPAPAQAPVQKPVERTRSIATLERRPPEPRTEDVRNDPRLSRHRARPFQVPPESLSGDPDALTLAPPPLPTLQKPRVVFHPPVKVDPIPRKIAHASPAPRRRSVGRARDLAERGRWGEVLALCAKSPDDPEATRLSRRAHQWAGELLDEAVEAAGRSDYEDALGAIEKVIQQMPGEPEYVDAARGLSAIKALLELRFLDPKGAVAPAVRRQAYEDLRGTRWAILFTS